MRGNLLVSIGERQASMQTTKHASKQASKRAMFYLLTKGEVLAASKLMWALGGKA